MGAVLSAGAAAMSLVFAAHALGYAASWITEWYAYDRRVLDALGVAPQRAHRRLRPYRPRRPSRPRTATRPPLDEIVTRYSAA